MVVTVYQSECVIFLMNFTFMWPGIITNFIVMKPTICTNFTNLFWHETCRVSCQNKFVKLVHKVGFITKGFLKAWTFINDALRTLNIASPIYLFVYLLFQRVIFAGTADRVLRWGQCRGRTSFLSWWCRGVWISATSVLCYWGKVWNGMYKQGRVRVNTCADRVRFLCKKLQIQERLKWFMCRSLLLGWDHRNVIPNERKP